MLFLQVLSIISTAQLEYLTVKIKEDFELVIEVRVFLRTIIKLVSCPVFRLLMRNNDLAHHLKFPRPAHTFKTSVT